MLGSGAALLVAAVIGGELAPGVALRAETAAGQAPVVPQESPRTGWSSTIEPRAELNYLGPVMTGGLAYLPRLHLRRPNSQDSQRPLLLHTAEGSLQARGRRELIFRSSAAVSVGEADYATLPALLGTTQAALPPTLEIFTARAALSLEGNVSRRWALGLGLESSHRRPLDSDKTAASALPPESGATPSSFDALTSLAARPTVSHRASRHDTVSAEAGVRYEELEDQFMLLSAEPRLLWRRQLAPTRTLRLAAGVSHTTTIARARATGPGAVDGTSPLGEGGYQAVFHRSPTSSWQLELSLGFVRHTDPVLGSAGTQARSRAGLRLVAGPGWTAGLEAGFGTSVETQPLPGAPDETFTSVTVPVSYRLSPHLALDGGLRYSDRGPHLRAARFAFHQRELWVFLGATVSMVRRPGAASP
jgi:hypothetical protein